MTKKRKRESDEEDYSFDSRRIKSGEIDDDLEELDEEMISKIVEQAPEVCITVYIFHTLVYT